MRLDVQGHPLHTRALGVILVTRGDGKLAAHGSLVDVRKRGLVPVAGDLQGTGLIHSMRLDGVIDPASATLESIAAQQPVVAFEASATTGGESCRDPIARVDAMAGALLDEDFARRISASIGGPRGCSHLVTLGHLLGATAAWALAREREAYGVPERPAGQRIFRRDVILDGHEPVPGELTLTLQLGDLHFAPAPPIARPMERLGAQREVRVRATVDLKRFALGELAGAERRRTLADLETAPWRARGDVLDGLRGLPLSSGVTATLLERLGKAPDDRPLLDALLMVAPMLIQCAAALSETWPAAARGSASLIGMGGLPDSCYMWRRDGVLTRARQAEGGG